MPLAEAEVIIHAPIELVWRVMLDLGAYAAWNPFVVRIDCADAAPTQGIALVLHVRWKNGKGTTVGERVTRLEPPANGRAMLEYAFEGPLSSLYLVRARRQQGLEALSDGRTRYTTTERLTGLLAWATPIRDVRDGFDRHARALKARVEALARGGSA